MESFDVFDTVLTRAVGSPQSVFMLLGRRLRECAWIELSPEAFADERMRAESRTRHRVDSGEVTLEQIYRELGDLLPPDRQQAARTLECELEASLIRAVPGAVQRVQRARAQHGRALFVSDMYLPGETITQWLRDHGLWNEGDRLYLSCEEGEQKASGKLFKIILEREGLEAGTILHHGNHPSSDVEVPAGLGLRVQPFLEGNPNRFEDLMETESHATDGLASALAGASRLARLSSASTVGVEQEALHAVSAGVLAPALTAFVVWLLRSAQAAGLSRMYFLARDGQILVDIARRLAPKLGIDCELRYLYASRQSFHLPAVVRIGDAQLEWMCICYDFLSTRSLLRRVGLEPEEVAGVFSQIGLMEADWDRQLTPVERTSVRALLTQSPLRDRILECAAETRAILIGYLSQEGLLDDDSWAIVDIGWNGRLQASLGEVLATVDRPAPRGFYYALATRPAAASAGMLEAFLFDETDEADGAQPSLFPSVNVATLMEMACAADHGTAEGFAIRHGRYEPVLRSERNQPAIDWGLPVMQDTLRRFAEELVLDVQCFDASADLRPLSRKLLTAFWTQPTRSEADVWGRFPFDNDQSGLPPQTIAQPFTGRELLRSLLGGATPQRSVSGWREGSLALSPPPVRLAVQISARIQRLVHAALGAFAVSNPPHGG